MKNNFKATFITKEYKELSFEFEMTIDKKDLYFELVDDLSKEEFLNHYLSCIQKGINPFVINPKIPNELKKNIYQTTIDNLDRQDNGHILCSSGTTSLKSKPKTFYFPI